MSRHQGTVALFFVIAIGSWPTVSRAQTSLDATLKPYLDKYGLPALAAAVVKDGKIVASGAVGTRRFGESIPVTVNDRFHLGSDTKAMTALIAAMLIEEGKLRWDSTVAEVFPDVADKLDSGLRGVTLEQLLSHTSGIPSDNAAFMNVLLTASLQPGNLDEQRYWLVKQWGTQKLESKPGSKFAYANVNYIIAGSMIERTANKTWDELIVDRVFTPLDLKTAGLGPQSTLGRIDAPLGHVVEGKKTRSFLAGPRADNLPVLGPAGIAHMSVLDFARWAGWNAGRGKRGPRLVKPETMTKLQNPVITMSEKKDAAPGTPGRGGYAFGWGTMTVEWAPKPLITHSGSNTMNLAQIWLDPEGDLAMVLVTNIGGTKAAEAFKALAPELYRLGAVKK